MQPAIRNKSQSVQVKNPNNPLSFQKPDYNQCIYECVILRKKFIGVAPRYFYLFPDTIAICKEQHKPIPERQFSTGSETRISWTYKAQPKKDFKLIKSIVFHSGNKEYEYLGEDKVLRELKQKLAIYVFQTKIQEEYQAESILDKGSYATVLELVNLQTKKTYAAKCIDQKKIAEKQNAQQQLSFEIQTMRVLSHIGHQNILRLHELFLGNQNYYIIMELAQGGSLLSVMKKRETLFDHQEITEIMRQILLGLAFMHTFRLMHRDLKPENLLFMQSNDINSLKIADFGLAQSIDDHPFLYPKCGTPGFVAPEVLAGLGDDVKYGLECDIFSTGVIYYILLTGEPLFDSSERKVLLELNKKCEIDFNQLDPTLVYKDEKDLLVRMLSKNPQYRPTANQCLEHKVFSKQPLTNQTQFQSQDYDMDECELDMTQQNNIAKFMQKKMPCFIKNPFIKNKVQPAFKIPNDQSFLALSNLRLEKDSDTSNKQENYFNFGSFNNTNNSGYKKSQLLEIVEEEQKQ